MKTYRIMYVTMDPAFLSWASLQKKMKEILKELNTVKNGKFTIDIEYRKGLLPVVDAEATITHDWMDGLSGPYYDQGYDFVVLHMSNAQKEKAGVRPTLNGAAQNDSDMIGEAYVMCDENDKRGPYNKFVQVTLHEVRHMLKRGTRKEDDTHTVHGFGVDIRGHFKGIDMSHYESQWYNLKAQVGVLTRLVALLKQRFFMKTLYTAALDVIGTDISPKDRAPDVVGCAESVSEVIRRILPTFPIILGTYSLWQELERNSQFKRVSLPMPGTVILSPTGLSRIPNAPFPGHVGIFLEGNKIASNTSANGLFEQNYTLEKWKTRWEEKGGYPIYYYQLIN